jgi:predicted regulator of Ras-like GTPase activity (Roadblock/LC7/MglB family)
MFQDSLEQVLQNTPGAVAVTLMGFDGIAVANSVVQTSGGSEQAEYETVAIELGSLVSQFSVHAEELGVGSFRELVIEGERLTTVVRTVTPEYFIALSLLPGGNSGKGRYNLRALGPKLVPDLT